MYILEIGIEDLKMNKIRFCLEKFYSLRCGKYEISIEISFYNVR